MSDKVIFEVTDGSILIFWNTVPKVKTTVFANSVDPDEVAHNEPPHLDLHCFPSSLDF